MNLFSIVKGVIMKKYVKYIVGGLGFFLTMILLDYVLKSDIDLTYKIQGGYIFTSIKEGTIEMSYQAILIDDDGYPMIPDNSKFTRALEAYIKKQWFTILFDMSKIQAAIYQNVQQEYAWAVGACESEFQKMSLDKAESFYNSWSTLIPRRNQHQRFYSYNGSKQNLKMN